MTWEHCKTIGEVLVSVSIILGALWASIRLVHKSREKALFFSGCHIIPLTLRDALLASNPKFIKELSDHALRPLIILPRKLRGYLNVKDGASVILSFNPPDDDELIVVAQAFWYPADPELWDLFEQPALSLTLRRYSGIERPTLGADEKVPPGWRSVEHGTLRAGRQEMAILHRTSEKNGNLIWLCREQYSSRFWLPEKNVSGAEYRDKWADGWFLEYSGIILRVSRPSILSIVG
jgi:hypothetical protein